MIATRFEVIGRPDHAPFRGGDLRNFSPGEADRVPAREILDNPHIALYGLDFENSQAVFVETSAYVNLSHAAFYPVTQFEEAERIYTIPFETMLMLAKSVAVDDSRLISIYSVGRCGSTLASQIFAQVPGIINISEPGALSQLVIARNSQAYREDDLIALLQATIGMLCKTPAEKAWVIKGQSFVIELGDWWHELYPHTKNLFLYRHAETWLQSGLRAYSPGVEGTDQERRIRENARRGVLGSLVPAIAQYDANKHLTHASILSLVWLSSMERYMEYHEMGIEMLAIWYTNWKTKPQETAIAMLNYCHCKPADLTAVYQTLNKDAKAGTI